MTFLAFDCETGGLGTEVSLLTSYLAVLDKDYKVTSELDLKVIPDDGIYRVQPKGMEVNKINLTELAQEAIPYKQAKKVLGSFLEKEYKKNGKIKLIPIGQNVQFDVIFLKNSIAN